MVKVYFQMLKGSWLCSQWWDLTDPYFNVCPDKLKGFKKSNEKWRRQSGQNIIQIYFGC